VIDIPAVVKGHEVIVVMDAENENALGYLSEVK
jgi:hypothetical protein